MRSIELWLKGLVAAAIGGGANAITAALVDQEHFNPFTAGWKNFAEMAVAGAVIAVAHFLTRSPLPGSPEAEGVGHSTLVMAGK